MFVIMVRGLLIRLNFPYVQFPCVSMSGDQLFDLVWEAVYISHGKDTAEGPRNYSRWGID